MRWIAAMALLISINAQAARFTAPDGTIVMEGQPVSKVLIHFGNPLNVNKQVVCGDQKRDYCARWVTIERWYYRLDGIYWTLVVAGGTVQKISWTR
ncbi:hypothetical protein ACFVYJ_01390 [Pontibacter sp. JAM-7]|uniref:hypothetical protein n=1 Tax=Pontibacter sp. JAM-7 TaxID=3366581 RepID=UPI003AF525CA